MRTSLVILVTLALGFPTFAGCIRSPNVDPNAGGALATLPALSIQGATAGAANATSALFDWKGAAPLAVGDPVGLVGGVSPGANNVALAVPAPQGVLFTLNATLRWQSSSDLDLFVLDGKGNVKCASAHGSSPTDAAGKEQCATRLFEPLVSAEVWKVEVVSYSNPTDELPFDVTLRYDVLPKLALLGAPLLPLAAGEKPALSFAAPVLISKSAHSGEPSLAIDAKDTVYVAAPVGPQQALFRSKDGQTFEAVKIAGVPPFPVGGGDSDVAVDGTNDIYFADLQACNTVSSTHDAGASWFNDPLACDTPLVDRQWLATDGTGQTVWLAFNGNIGTANAAANGDPTGSGSGATVMKSIDGGKTFPIRTYPPERDFCARGNIQYSKSDSMLYLAGCNNDGPGVAASSDGGLTWTWHTVAKRSGKAMGGFCYTCNIFTVLDVDRKGDVYVVWSDPSNGTLDVWFAASRDKGVTWSVPVKVDAVKGTHVLPWVASGPDGKAVVVWYGTKYQGDPNKATGEWYAMAAVTENANDATPTFKSALLSPEPVQYGPICTAGSSCASGRNLLDFFEAALDSHGDPRVSYVDGRPGGSASQSLLMYVGATS